MQSSVRVAVTDDHTDLDTDQTQPNELCTVSHEHFSRDTMVMMMTMTNNAQMTKHQINSFIIVRCGRCSVQLGVYTTALSFGYFLLHANRNIIVRHACVNNTEIKIHSSHFDYNDFLCAHSHIVFFSVNFILGDIKWSDDGQS